MAHQDPADGHTALPTAAARLCDLAGLALADRPLADLQAGLRRAGTTLTALGRNGGGPAVVLVRREGYLTDAVVLLRAELTRLTVALAAPAESDLSVQVARTRDAVGYLADITADLLPASMCRSIVEDLGEHSAVMLVPMLEQLLAVCGLAEQVTARATAALGGAQVRQTVPAGQSLLQERRAEIERLIATLSI